MRGDAREDEKQWGIVKGMRETEVWGYGEKPLGKGRWCRITFYKYNPIRVRPTLDLPKFLESPDGEAAFAKIGSENFAWRFARCTGHFRFS